VESPKREINLSTLSLFRKLPFFPANGLSTFRLPSGLIFSSSFARSLVANVYGKGGYHCYDPASIFCLEISRVPDGYKGTKSFCRVLRDPRRGLRYWAYAGLTKEHIPSEDNFSNFRGKCEGETYREILAALVNIAYSLGFLYGSLVASTDGTLFPTFSRFEGCDYFEKECQRIQITGLLSRIKKKSKRVTSVFPENL